MTIKSKAELEERPIIDLTGPEGNVFCLMAKARDFLKQLGRASEWEQIKIDMLSGNYEHLLEVFEREFGSFVTLYR